jgi:outer membrane lipase/esterase
MKLKKLAAALSALSVMTLAAPAQAVQFSQTIFFGDSLTDSGSYGARFTTNPGTVWAQNLAAQLGTSALPFLGAGGTDFAEGGARVSQVPGIGAPAVPATPVSQQIDAYLAMNPKADPNALYTVWAGANDIFTQAGLAGAGAITAAQAQAGVVQAANDQVAQILRLKAAGAHYVIVPNLPDIGSTPMGVGSGAASTFTALSQLYNQTLSSGLNGVSGLSIISLNTFALLHEVIANPSQFGFVNVTTPACTTSSSLMCTPSTLVTPNAAQTYSFADGVHPTTAAHKIISDYAYSILVAPAQIGMLAETPLHAGDTQRYALDNRMRQPMANRQLGSFEAWINVDYTPVNVGVTSVSPGLSSHDQNATVGADAQFTDRILAGAAFGYSDMSNDFGNNNGNFHQNMSSLTLYSLWKVGGSSYLNALATVGTIDYSNINRSFALGISTRTENGTTSGSYKALRVGGGMDLANGRWTYGPLATLTWQKATVDSYSEDGSDSSAMGFGEQNRTALTGAMGGRVSYNAGQFQPFLQATFQRDFKDEARTVTANVSNMPGSFALPAYVPAKNYGLLSVGAITQLSKAASALVSVDSILGQRDTRSTGVGVNFRYGF